MGDTNNLINQLITVGVITVSDRCYLGESKDLSGPALIAEIKDGLLESAEVTATSLVPDEQSLIQESILNLADVVGVNLLLTTGGTGFSPRDVTPEATEPLIEKKADGVRLMILSEGLKKTPFAGLSRGIAGVRGRTMIVNLPGSKKGAVEGLRAIAPIVRHAVDLLLDRKQVVASHSNHHSKPYISKVTINCEESTRVRNSPYPMVPMKEVDSILRTAVVPLSPVSMSSVNAIGHVLAEAVTSKEDLPPFRTSMKDGYAIFVSDGADGGDYELFTIVGECKPGKQCTTELKEKECIKISTGCCLPPSANFIVPVENSKPHDRKQVSLLVSKPSTCCDIREIGCDIRQFSVVLPQGIVLGPPELSTLAAIGQSTVTVKRKPVVGVLSSGDELQDPWLGQDGFKVRDSNKIALLCLLNSWDYNTIDLGTAKDSPDDVLTALSRGFDAADVVITTGGMSMGERDVIKQVLQTDLNAKIFFGRLQMKPGKPTGFGVVDYAGLRRYWFGLPGNPASAFVTSYLLVLPALRLLSGYPGNIYLESFDAELLDDVKPDHERVEYQRGICQRRQQEGGLLFEVRVTRKDGQQSSCIAGCMRANCLMEIPQGKSILPAGSTIKIHMLNMLL